MRPRISTCAIALAAIFLLFALSLPSFAARASSYWLGYTIAKGLKVGTGANGYSKLAVDPNTGGLTAIPGVTTGTGWLLTGTTLTTGNLFKITGVDATINGGKYINIFGGTGTTSVFSIGELGAVTSTGTIDPTVTNTVAGGDRGIQLNITQATNALTGTLDGIYVRATAGDTGKAGTIRGCEIGARVAEDASAEDGAAVVTGGYFWADAKTEQATILRGLEVSLDGAAGGTSTTAAGIEIFNNSSATQTNSYAVDVNEGSASGRKAFTKDVRLQNGETIDNATDGIIAVSGVLKASTRFATIVANTNGAETLDATQSGVLVIASKADGATTITIPDPSAATVGVVYYLMQTANQSLVVTATTANSNSIVCDGVATSDNVTISTAGHLIGAGMIVIGISATQWYVGGLNPESLLTPEAAD